MEKQNKAVEGITLLQSQISSLTEKVKAQSQIIQQQSTEIHDTEFSKNITNLTDKVKELTEIVKGNVSLMDDVLEHTNSVLTLYVGIWSVITALLIGGVTWYLNIKANEKVQNILEKSFKQPNVKDTVNTFISEYFVSETGQDILRNINKVVDEPVKIKEGDLLNDE